MACLYLMYRRECRVSKQIVNLAHQIWGQTQPSQLSDTVLGWFCFLLSCGIGLWTQKHIHLITVARVYISGAF